MSRFVDKSEVSYVCEDGSIQDTAPAQGEYMVIRKRLNVAEENILQGAAIAIDKGNDLTLNVSRFLLTLEELFIADWRLLDAGGAEVKFEHAKIKNLDPNDPLVEAALTEIALRNPTARRKLPAVKSGSKS